MATRVGANPIGVGKSPAGVERVGPYSTAPSLATVPAVEYLGQNYDYSEIPTDPIDVDVALAMSVRRKSIKHAPDCGNDLYTISPIGGPDEQQKALELTKRATPLDRRLAAGDIAILSVDTSHDNDQLRVRLRYRNLRTQKNRTA